MEFKVENKEWENNNNKWWRTEIHVSHILIAHPLEKKTFLFQTLVCIDQQVNEELQYGEFLKLHWSDFHLGSLGGVLMSFPVIPVDTISVWWVLSVMIQTVQVGVMTLLVPPGSFKAHSTVSVVAVIILIFGGKGVTTMRRQRITSSSLKQNMNIDLR